MTPSSPSRVRRFAGYMLGFGVSFAVGLAPYLGQKRVPGFTPILAFLPPALQNSAIALSAALMGVVAVVIQWYAGEHVSRGWLRKIFKRALCLVLASFVVLIVVHTRVVVTVEDLAGGPPDIFIVGLFRPDKTDKYGEPICPPDMSNSRCIQSITVSKAAVESHWGSTNVQIGNLALILSYLLFMSSFGLLVGLLLLKDEKQDDPRQASQEE